MTRLPPSSSAPPKKPTALLTGLPVEPRPNPQVVTDDRFSFSRARPGKLKTSAGLDLTPEPTTPRLGKTGAIRKPMTRAATAAAAAAATTRALAAGALAAIRKPITRSASAAIGTAAAGGSWESFAMLPEAADPAPPAAASKKTASTDLPLHARERLPQWHDLIRSQKGNRELAVYMQTFMRLFGPRGNSETKQLFAEMALPLRTRADWNKSRVVSALSEPAALPRWLDLMKQRTSTKDAKRIVEWMHQFGPAPDVAFYNAAISVILRDATWPKERRYRDIVTLSLEMQDRGVAPNLHSRALACFILCITGRIDEAVEVFEQHMEEEPGPIDNHTKNCVVKGFELADQPVVANYIKAWAKLKNKESKV
jgi:hypothetical protein